MHMAKYTDLLICLNNEDYESSLKFKTRGRAIYVPGVGVDLKKFSPITDNFRKEKICKEFNLNNEVIFVNVGELSKRKNQKIILQALSNIKCIKWKLIIVGIGDELEYLKSLSKELNINNNVIFAGYRNDIADILSVADFFVFSSIQEGLPVALMEAMALNVICIASKIRGNIDLIKNNVNGLLFENNDVESLVSAINYALDFDLVKKRNIKLTMHDTIKNFSLENVSTIMINIYSDFLGE